MITLWQPFIQIISYSPSEAALDRSTVSLITVVLNGGAAFERAVRSVVAQSYQPIEYIVIDGGSSDGTIDVIKHNADRITHWTSEPDRGISHAFNKGLAAARGDYIGLVNSDDWLEPDQVEKAVLALEHSRADFVFGDLAYHDPDGDFLHLIRGDPDYASTIRSRMPALNHPTMLVRRQVYEKIGTFDERYKFAMDYDWALRAHLAGCHGCYAPDLLGHMTLDGVSDRRFIEGLAEVRQIAQHHGQSAAAAWPLFGMRIAKGLGQRLLKRHAPTSLYDRLRGWINPHYARASNTHRPSNPGPSRS
jgi:GT2 family glycosyltransferase